MSRESLPARRDSTLHDFAYGGGMFCASVSHFADGRPAEIFITMNKTGNRVYDEARNSAVLVSLALQYGCPVEVIRAALTKDEFGAPTCVVGAVLDVIAEGGA